MDLSISVAIIAALLLVNTVVIIMVLLRGFRTLGEAQKLMEMVRLQIVPISHDVTQILTDVRSIVHSVEREMGKLGEGITAVRDTARNIQNFEALLQERIERPLLDVTAILSALVRGGRVFWNHLGKEKVEK